MKTPTKPTFRVANLMLGEIIAELNNIKDAIDLCDKLENKNAKDNYYVVLAELVVYEKGSQP
jgi:hypothetical protein